MAWLQRLERRDQWDLGVCGDETGFHTLSAEELLFARRGTRHWRLSGDGAALTVPELPPRHDVGLQAGDRASGVGHDLRLNGQSLALRGTRSCSRSCRPWYQPAAATWHAAWAATCHLQEGLVPEADVDAVHSIAVDAVRAGLDDSLLQQNRGERR